MLHAPRSVRHAVDDATERVSAPPSHSPGSRERSIPPAGQQLCLVTDGHDGWLALAVARPQLRPLETMNSPPPRKVRQLCLASVVRDDGTEFSVALPLHSLEHPHRSPALQAIPRPPSIGGCVGASEHAAIRPVLPVILPPHQQRKRFRVRRPPCGGEWYCADEEDEVVGHRMILPAAGPAPSLVRPLVSGWDFHRAERCSSTPTAPLTYSLVVATL